MAVQSFLTELFETAVASASARAILPARLPRGHAKGRTLVLGCGKAAAAMAEVAASNLEGDVLGCVVTRYGHGAKASTGKIEVIEASHPQPDAASREAGRKIRELAESATKDDRVIFLVSGGGSALLCDPIEGLTLDHKAAITDHLVKSGVPINQINLVRRHLSRVKGGRLAAAASQAAVMHTFLISDVVGDDPAAIASGPSVASLFEVDAALAVLAGSGWGIEPSLVDAIHAAKPPEVPAHPIEVLAAGRSALEAAARHAKKEGWRVVRLGDELEGDASETGRSHAAAALDHVGTGQPTLLLSGGELTVTVRAQDGRGGPNLEYLTGLMAALPAETQVTAMACDTDGIDGSEDNAGGWFNESNRASPERCEQALDSNRTYDLFEELDGLVITGPTRTNVNDIRMIAVGG